MANQLILTSILTALTLTVVTAQNMLPNSDCKSDYYIREYHYHDSDNANDKLVSTTSTEFVPKDLQHVKEVTLLQRELIEEKTRRQKDVHYMLRIVDRLLRRTQDNDDVIENEAKVIGEEQEGIRFDTNDTTDLREEWETATKKFRKDRKRSRKDRGNLRNYRGQDPQLRSDEGRPSDPSVTLDSGPRNEAKRERSNDDDLRKIVKTLQQEIKGLQARQVQIFRAYKKGNMALKRSSTQFRQTMDKHQRLQMFHTSEVARLKWQLTNETASYNNRLRAVEAKLECVTLATGIVALCPNVAINSKYNQKAKSKQIRDVSQQVVQDSHHRQLQYSVTEEATFDAAMFEPKTMTVVVDDVIHPEDNGSDDDKEENSQSSDSTKETEINFGTNIDDINNENTKIGDLDIGSNSNIDLDLSGTPDGNTDADSNDDDITMISEDISGTAEVGSSNNPLLTSLSTKGLWEILLKAGKNVALWSEARQNQKLPIDCSDIDPWSQRWSPKQTIYIGKDRTPLKVKCHNGWLLIQENKYNSTTDKSWDFDSYEIGIESNNFFWIGTRYLNMLTASEEYSVRIELETFHNKTMTTEYSTFKVSSAGQSFKLEVGEIKRDEIGDIVGEKSFNPIAGFEFIVPILPVTLPSGVNDHNPDTYRESTTLRGWWYPRRSTMPNTTAQTKLPTDNADCYTHLNSENPFYCDVRGDVIRVKSTKMLIRRNR